MHLDLGLLVRDVVRRDVGVDGDVEPHGLAIGDLAVSLGRGNGLIEHLHVQLKAERGNVAGLLVAQQVAGAAKSRSRIATLKPAPSSV